jgi:alkanesulfonate monooxygenase SsuD/methylene tetrahydromethanopterin reductase-like flavin-dependent oxidoreductase (luciferase family)
MRIGVIHGVTAGEDGGLDGVVRQAQAREAEGFATFWLPNIFGLDAITTLALAGRATKAIELGTAVVPTYPRHPIAMAQQALTAGVAANGRFTLGLGLSHKLVIEDLMGMSYAAPVRHMREYLSVLQDLLAGRPSKFAGQEYRVNLGLQVPGAKPVPVLVAALGEQMLRLCGLFAAAKEAGRPQPRIVANLPIALTNAPDAAKQWVGQNFAIYGSLPSYRAMLDREGAAGPADVTLAGDEKALDAALGRLRDLGVSDFAGAIAAVDRETARRTLAFLASRA